MFHEIKLTVVGILVAASILDGGNAADANRQTPEPAASFTQSASDPLALPLLAKTAPAFRRER